MILLQVVHSVRGADTRIGVITPFPVPWAKVKR